MVHRETLSVSSFDTLFSFRLFIVENVYTCEVGIVNIWLNTVLRWQKETACEWLQFAVCMGRKYATISQFFFFLFCIFIHVIFCIQNEKAIQHRVRFVLIRKVQTIHFVILDKPFRVYWNDSACNCTMTSLNYLSPEQKRKQNRYFTFEEHFCHIHFSIIIWIAVISSPLSHRSNIQLCTCLHCTHFYAVASIFFQLFDILCVNYLLL